MGTLRKRNKILLFVLAALCALALGLGVMSLAPERAFAEEGDVIEVQFNGETTTYTTVEDALAYTDEQETSEQNRAVIKLLDNYVLGANGDDSWFEVGSDTFATLDLNGYILWGSGSGFVIRVYGDMILKDSQSESTAEEHQHNYYVDESGLWMVDDGSTEWQAAYNAAENKGSITGGIITGGDSSNYGGGIYLDLYGASGGGILTMNGGTIAGNQAEWGGGGVFVNRNTGFEMNGGMIAGNISPGSPTFGLGYGGGIMINDPPIKYCVINGGAIRENVANIGGGITSAYTENLITITGGEIANNYAPQAGGLYISGTLELSGGEIYGNEAEIYGGMFVNDTLNMSGGKVYGNAAETEGGIYAATVNLSGGEIYDNAAGIGGNAISAVFITISGGKISGDISFIIIEGAANTIEVTSGYFAEGVEYGEENGNTVNGFSVADGYAVVLLDGNSGDENYSEKFPYAVYQIGSGENVSFDVSGASAAYDGGQIAAGEDFVLKAESGGTTIAVDEIAYSYSSDGVFFTDGLPSNAGTYIVKASVSGIIDAENHIFYEGAEYTFAYQIAPAEPNVVGVAVSIDENDTVSVDSFSVVGIMEGSDVSVVVKSCAMLEDGRVRVVYALSGSDAANYLVPGDTYTTIQRSGLEEVNAAIEALNAALEALESSASSSDEALQEAIDEVQAKLDEAVLKLEGAFAEGDEANAAALAEAVNELKTAFEAADDLLASDIAELESSGEALQAALDALDEAYRAADEALAASVEELKAQLDEAVSRLEQLLSEGDEANAAALAEAVSELKTAFEAADDLLASDIAELESSGEALQAALDALDEAYRAADEAVLKTIGELQTENDGLREELGVQEKELNTLNVVVWVALAVAVLAVGVGAAGLVFGIKAGKRDNSAS